MNTTLIIYTHNSEAQLKKTLSHHISLFNAIIIVDDHSEDETVDYIKTHFEQCYVIKNPYFMGYAASINTAIESAETEWVIVIQADTQLEPGRLVTPDQNTIVILPSHLPQVQFSFRSGRRSCRKADQLSQVIAINKEKFIHMGGLDLLYYPGGYEWADIIYNAQQRGWRVESDPDWKVSTGSKLISHWYDHKLHHKILTVRNELLLTWKTTDHWAYWLSHSVMMVISLLLFRIQLFRGFFHALRQLTALRHSRKMRVPYFLTQR
jgi:glycosyltransferase involved in cell wall biosynthesis